jgi:hypothetical protein
MLMLDLPLPVTPIKLKRKKERKNERKKERKKERKLISQRQHRTDVTERQNSDSMTDLVTGTVGRY